MNNKFTVGQAFIYKGRNTMFLIESVTQTRKGILYTVKYPGLRPDGKEFSRYYEERIIDDCEMVKNQNMSRILYA
jgi:hypothetical protein